MGHLFLVKNGSSLEKPISIEWQIYLGKYLILTFFKQIIELIKIRQMILFLLVSPEEINSIHITIPAEVCEINSSNVDKVRDFRDDIDPQKFENFLKKGDVGIYAIIDSKVVGHLWAFICREKSIRIDGFIKISKNEAVIHFATVYEKYRGKNIYPSMLSTLCNKLMLEKGVQKIYIITDKDNISSIKGIEKVGFKIYQKKLYLPIYKVVKVIDSVLSFFVQCFINSL